MPRGRLRERDGEDVPPREPPTCDGVLSLLCIGVLFLESLDTYNYHVRLLFR